MIFLIIVFLNGCYINNIVIDPVKTWEGHYMTIEEFKTSTSDIVLEKDETIWVLSNTTLKRVLKNLGR